MCGANRIAAHRLQLFEAPLVDGWQDGNADTRMVLVIADALELNIFAVEEASLVGIKANRTHSKVALVDIAGLACDLDMGFQTVKMRRCDTPELGLT